MPREKFGGRCHFVIKVLKWIPVIFITLIIFWSYYAYVYQLCTLTIESTYEQIIYIVIFHVLFVMILWSYFQTIFTDKGKVPEAFKVPEMDLELMITADSADIQHQILENLAKKLPITNININGSVRFCDKCKHIKPDRAHHCSVCGECVLKMDHHCPWINNCVSFTNYKFFVLFLGYALSYCVFIILTTLSYFIAFWRGELAGTSKFHILFLFFVAIMFGISLVSLFVYHCYLISENRTTLEAFRAPIFKRIGADKNGFYLGCCRNFEEVFGERPLLWFMPVNSSFGDGVSFPRLNILEERESLLRASGEPSP